MTELGEIPEKWQVDSMDKIVTSTQLGSNTLGKELSEIPMLKMGNLTIGGFNFNKLEYISKDELKNNKEYILQKGDFLFNTRNTLELVGKSAVWNEQIETAIFNSNIMRIKYCDKINDFYMGYYFSSDIGWRELKAISIGTTSVAAIYTKDLMKAKVIIPTIEEQEKIVSILSTVDEQIDNIDALIEKNKELKKGLMQTLLTKGIGHTKFKKTEIGEIPEEWEIKKLDECINTQTGFPFKSEMFNENEGLPLIRIRDILKSNIGTFYSGEYNEEYIVNYDDILISMDGDFNIAKWKNIKGLLNQRICRVSEKENISREYIFYVLNRVLKAIERATPSTTVKHLVIKDLVNTKIAIPTLDEQNIIGNTLFNIDRKIEIYEKKKIKLEEVKRGLMQQLLTGKIRVI